METNKQIIFDEEEIIVISKEDKDYIRTNILDAVIYSVNTENGKVLKQLNPCVKKIIKYRKDGNNHVGNKKNANAANKYRNNVLIIPPRNQDADVVDSFNI